MTRLLATTYERQPGYLRLDAAEIAILTAAEAALAGDLQFEHLADGDDDQIWEFVTACVTERATDHVPPFVKTHRRSLLKLVCYFPVEHLLVDHELTLGVLRLLPVDDAGISAEPWLSLDRPTGCVAAVDVVGTNPDYMFERARDTVLHGLRILRIALRTSFALHDRQLRFRLGDQYALEGRQAGRHLRDDAAFDFDLTGSEITQAAAQPIFGLIANPATDIEQKANLALTWMERAWLATEPALAVLYLFFGLEALLGRKSERRKEAGLAFRQMMLSHLLTATFTHPDTTLLLYAEIRSAAVHGEVVPQVDWSAAREFGRAVHNTINSYLTVSRDSGVRKRGQLLDMLDRHPDRSNLIDWLRRNAGSHWASFIDDGLRNAVNEEMR